ncbi:PDZ domain-containing protein [Paraburkholderia sp. ZP32-5]|uniref:PDZ domain-containing protein n=1 Tax=Paraburkholderia sp. ZP32-5 TaxID=2883245 RepID=UPI001F3EA31F|nr:PDZ domain-containing protein [Paraburkholderia sp. ZP32-5]
MPLEVRPSLGLFVVGYVNGRGPYRFSIGMVQHTLLTPAVVMDAGLATRDKGVFIDGSSNHIEEDLQLTDATLRLGDKETSLNGAHVFPDHDLSAYVPVPNYGGALGVEVFRNRIVRLDLSHSRLVLSPRTAATVPPPDSIELNLDQSANGADLDRLPAVNLSLDGQPGRFRVTFSAASVSFQEASSLGRNLLDKSPHQLTVRGWTPDGIVRSQVGTASELEIGGQRRTARVSLSRRLDILPVPIRPSPRDRVLVHEVPVDGVVGLRVLGAFDMTIDELAGKMWLSRRDKMSFPCRMVSSAQNPGAAGFTPWLYKGHGVVSSVIEGSAAEAAGIQPGDQIVSIDDGDVPAFYDHLDATCLAPAPIHVVFRNASGDHTAVLNPATP